MYQPTASESVHENAKDLYTLDLISEELMRWFDRPCLSELYEFKMMTARELKRIELSTCT